MKPRIVIVQIELFTNQSVKALKEEAKLKFDEKNPLLTTEVKQVHVNVIQKTKKIKKPRIDY